MNNPSLVAIIGLAMSAREVYPEDRAAIAANYATAGERQRWNEAVDEAKEQKASANRYTFVQRKASHKQA